MINRERIIAAIKHEKTDFVPYSFDFTHHEYEKVAEYLGNKDFEQKIGYHMSGVYYAGYPKESSSGSGYFKDDFGVVWNRNCADKDIGVIEGFVLTEPTMKNYKFPDFDEVNYRIKLDKLVETQKDNFKFAAIGFSMFERAWSLRGMENVLMDMIEEPEFLHELLDGIADYNLKIIDIALEYDIDAIMFGDDWGQQSGLIMGPRFWREFIKPRMAKMYTRAKNKGKYVIQHSCGDLRDIFSDLIDIGLDVYQTFQPEIYDLRKTKKEFGDRLTFWGGISTQRLLPYATPDEIKKVIRETIKILGENGGYIAGPTHSIPGDVPAENVIAMIEAFKNQ